MSYFVHEALKQFTKRLNPTCCGDSATIDAGGFYGTITRLCIPIPDRTQRRTKGRQSPSEETQPCQKKKHCTKSRPIPLGEEKVAPLLLHDSACHHGGPSRRHNCSSEIRLSRNTEQHTALESRDATEN